MKKRDKVERMMRRAKRTFLAFSDPMGKFGKTIERTCVICGEKLEIHYNRFTRGYVGGHYFFGKKDSLDSEYWECDDCFEGDEDE